MRPPPVRGIIGDERTNKEMPKLIHDLLCTVSRRYRVAHCRHVDELPPRMSRRLREECMSDIDPTPYKSAAEMWAAMEREWEEEDRAESDAHAAHDEEPGFVRKSAAVFA